MKYYFIGIKGTGMSGLACILNDLGNTVIGYDDYKEHKFNPMAGCLPLLIQMPIFILLY